MFNSFVFSRFSHTCTKASWNIDVMAIILHPYSTQETRTGVGSDVAGQPSLVNIPNLNEKINSFVERYKKAAAKGICFSGVNK